MKLMRQIGKLPLSARQAEVCFHMAQGLSYAEIAERLGIRPAHGGRAQPLDLRQAGRQQPRRTRRQAAGDEWGAVNGRAISGFRATARLSLRAE